MIIKDISFELPIAESPPEFIQVLPSGDFTGRDGRAFKNSTPELIISNFLQNEAPLPIDYEHATEADLGTLAPAMGWVTSLENRNGEIWAKVEWTPRGAEFVKNREYRFISPVFFYDDSTKRIVSISSIALTNKPNLKLRALNVEEMIMPITENPQELPTLVTKIIEILGLKADATAEDILSAVQALKDMETEEEPAQATEKVAMEKEIHRYRTDYEKLQSIALQTEQRATKAEKHIEALQAQMNEAKIQAFIDVEGANRISPAMRIGVEAFARYLCKEEGIEKGLQSLKTHIETFPEFNKEIPYAMNRIQNDDFKKVAESIAKGARQ